MTVCVHLLKGFDPGNQFPLRGPEMTESGNSNCVFDVSYIELYRSARLSLVDPLLLSPLAPSLTSFFHPYFPFCLIPFLSLSFTPSIY